MSGAERDIIVVVRHGNLTEEAFEHEVKAISRLLETTENTEQFCRVHELVNRNHITRKSFRIREAIRFSQLKPFRFLICLN